LRLRIRPRKLREPDLLLLLSASDPRRQNRFWDGADLVVEVASEDKPERDLVDKRLTNTLAGLPKFVASTSGEALPASGLFELSTGSIRLKAI